MGPVFGDMLDELDAIRDLDGSPESASVSNPASSSYIDKDLRTLLGKEVEGKFNLSYCGEGDLEVCRESLWAVVDTVSQELAEAYGGAPDTWLKEGARLSFVPGLIPETFRATNRPTYQQVLDFAPTAPE